MFKIEDFKCSNWRLQLFRTDTNCSPVHENSLQFKRSEIDKIHKNTSSVHESFEHFKRSKLPKNHKNSSTELGSKNSSTVSKFALVNTFPNHLNYFFSFFEKHLNCSRTLCKLYLVLASQASVAILVMVYGISCFFFQNSKNPKKYQKL